MKKILSLILAGVLLLSFVSCGKTGPDQASKETEARTNSSESELEPEDTESESETEKEVLKPEPAPIQHSGKDNGMKLTSLNLPVSPKYDEQMNDTPGSEYDDFYAMRNEQIQEYGKIKDGLDPFYALTVPEILDSEDKNVVYSPVNVYMALSLLAEISENDTREEILKLLSVKDIEELREKVYALWHANFCDNNVTTIEMANSVWLQKGLPVKEDCLKTFVEKYYADIFQGEMGTDDLNEALRSWLNEHTKDLLKDAVEGVETDVDTIIALASTLYFKGSWADEFDNRQNLQKTFHAYNNDEEDVTFMSETDIGYYNQFENFIGYAKFMNDGNVMLFALPKEGVTTAELAKDPEYLAFMSSTDDERMEQGIRAEVHFEVPKFDVSSDIDLIRHLTDLGINKVFDKNASDFSGILSDESIEAFVNEIEHAARVKIDEEGCEAAAFTVMMVKATGFIETPEHVDIILDRPFLFSLQSYSGAVLFTGAVNTVG